MSTGELKKTSKPIKAFHFFSEEDKLWDGRDLPANGVTLTYDAPLYDEQSLVEDGVTLPDKVPLVFPNFQYKRADFGLYGFIDTLDAFEASAGTTLFIIKCGGKVLPSRNRHYRKVACTEWTILARINMIKILQELARWCAMQTAHLWDTPNEIRQYLETGNENLRPAAEIALSSVKSATFPEIPPAAAVKCAIETCGCTGILVSQTARATAWYMRWLLASRTEDQKAVDKSIRDSQRDKLVELLKEAGFPIDMSI